MNFNKKGLLSLSLITVLALFSACAKDGSSGTDGEVGATGNTGTTGIVGKSAYQIWLDNNNTGTEAEYLNSLNGNINEVTITAVDGYILGATITDANGNIAFKNGDGTYSFIKAPKYPLTASGGTLKDTGETFTGTMYSAQGLVVSPLTTVVTTLDANGEPTATVNTTTLDKLAAVSGISKDEIVKDYMAESNVELAKLAQLIQVMNQDSDLMIEFKEQVDISTATGGFTSFKTIADTAIDKMTTQSKLSNVKGAVYKNILNDVESFSGTTPADIEAELQDTKVALSNIAAVEALGGEIGTDAAALSTATKLMEITGNSESTVILTVDELTTLGANTLVTENATLVVMMNDIIKNSTSQIDSKAEVTTYADNLEKLYLLDTQNDSESDKTTALKTVVEILAGKTIGSYQAYELDNILDTNTQEITSYADLITLVDGLSIINKPSLSVALATNLDEKVGTSGIVVGTKVASANAVFDENNKSVLKEFTLAQTGDFANFDINATSGDIKTLIDFDYETKRSHTITVEVNSKLTGDPKGNGSVVDVGSESKIITLNVTDLADFGILNITYDNKSDSNVSNDTLSVNFNAKADETTLSTDKFTVVGAGAIDTGAIGNYNSTTKTYKITGFTTAMVVNEDGNASSISMDTSVKQEGSDLATLTTTADLKIFTFNGNEYGLVKSPDTNVTWLDRNLGASQVATAFNDANAYGDLYQWGETVRWTSIKNESIYSKYY